MRPAFLLSCLQQVSLTVGVAVGAPSPIHPLSGDVHRRSSLPSSSPQPHSRRRVLPVNNTALANLTDGILGAQNSGAYCEDGDSWFGPLGNLDVEDCHKAILSMRNDGYAGTDIFTSFTWTFPGFDSRTHKFTPRSYVKNNCVLSIWPRYLAAGADEIREAQPQGLHPSDVADLSEIGFSAFQVYDQCVLGRVPASAGWIPAGERSSLFVGFWERDSAWDDWADDLHQNARPVMNGSVATT